MPVMQLIHDRRRRASPWWTAAVLAGASTTALAVPRYVADLLRANDLDAGVVNGTSVRFLAGPRFATLVPASQQEICQILRDYYVTATPGVRSIRIVDAATHAVVSCE
jgi:hypothetical protein